MPTHEKKIQSIKPDAWPSYIWGATVIIVLDELKTVKPILSNLGLLQHIQHVRQWCVTHRQIFSTNEAAENNETEYVFSQKRTFCSLPMRPTRILALWKDSPYAKGWSNFSITWTTTEHDNIYSIFNIP